MMTNDLFPDSGEAGFKTVWSATNTQVEQTLTLFFFARKEIEQVHGHLRAWVGRDM